MSMIDLGNETTISLAQAAARLPSNRLDRPVTASCVLRWVLTGVKVPGGGRVKLEAVRLGGRWLTSVEALGRFAAAQTPDLDAPAGGSATPRPPARRRASERAARELERLGI
jgi:hypothetical protein